MPAQSLSTLDRAPRLTNLLKLFIDNTPSRDLEIAVELINKKDVMRFSENLVEPLVAELMEDGVRELLTELKTDPRGRGASSIDLLNDEIAITEQITLPDAVNYPSAGDAQTVLDRAYDAKRDEIEHLFVRPESS